jgi:antitoxin component YwqK of YwqJK toxin-antitoxin module
MSRGAYKPSIPATAVEVVEDYHQNGAKRSASYFVDGEKVGYREWFEDGQLSFEYAMRGGVQHGPEYRFYPNGQLEEKETYRDGRFHGTGMQWSEDGRLLVTWKLVNGAGLDLWCDCSTGTLAEEHYWPEEEELGYKREWNPDEKTIWQEYFYVLGKGYHGVWREWNEKGRLRRGFPLYFVNDKTVTKREYLKACARDPSLPPFRVEDNDPHRELPAEYRAQRKRT